MSWVDSEFDYSKQKWDMVLKPNQTDLDVFRVIKLRQPTICHTCRKELKPKTYAFGGGYWKLCLDCGEMFCHKGLEGVKEVEDYIKTHIQRLSVNKDKWRAENMITSL